MILFKTEEEEKEEEEKKNLLRFEKWINESFV